MKYQSELIKEIVDTRGHEKSSIHYESECVESWIEETKGAYPKLCDYQSEWLNYIVENPLGEFPYETVTDVTDATINNVVPYAYKSAILKGQTLVNLANYELATSSNELLCRQDFSLQKNNTAYTLFNFTDKIIAFNTYTTSSTWRGFENVEANSKRILTLNDFTIKEVVGRASNGWDKTTETEKFLKGYMIIEGDYTNVDIPYFEGMQSVKMPVLTTTGKNLFDMKNSNFITEKDGNYYPSSNSNLFDTYTLLPNTSYTISGIFGGWGKCFINGVSLGSFKSTGKRATKKFTTDATGVTTIFFGGNSSSDDSKPCNDFQLEIGDTFTTYEPFKSNILTLNEPIELHGIGEVKDELDLLTGELTQRLINMGNLGDYDMANYTVHNVTHSSSVPVLKISFDVPFKIVNTGYGATNNLPLVCDKFKIIGDQNGYSVDRGSYVSSRDNQLVLHLIKEEVGLPMDKPITKEIVKEFLKENPIEVTSRLVEPVIKTVDLTITNQNGESLSKMTPIEGTMHIHSDGTPLKPTITLEIPVEATTQNLASFIKEE